MVTEHFARPEGADAGQSPDAEMRSVIVFRLRTEWYAIHTAVCLEIAAVRPIHSLPHRRDTTVLGVVNVHGALMACISLAVIVGATACPGGTQTQSPSRAAIPRLLVARRAAATVVFPVDEVQGMARFRARDLKEVPATLAHARSSYARALLQIGDKSAGLLDEQRLFSAVERALA